MPNKYDPISPWATVIDSEGNHVMFVEVYPDWQGNIIPERYDMQEGETLVFTDWQTANDLATKWTQPKWDGKKWIAGGDEIPQPEPPDIPPEQPGGVLALPPEAEHTLEQYIGFMDGLIVGVGGFE